MQHRNLQSLMHTKVTDCFSLRFHWQVGAMISQLQGLEIWVLPFLFSSAKVVQKAVREQKAHRAAWSSLHWAQTPGEGWCKSTQAKTLKNSTAGLSSRRPAWTTRKHQVKGAHRTTKLQCLGEIVHRIRGFFGCDSFIFQFKIFFLFFPFQLVSDFINSWFLRFFF